MSRNPEGESRIVAHVSIHDVMPRTLDATQSILDRLAELGTPRATLLVVPGLAWKDREIDRLRAWQSYGHELAGHGDVHRARHIRGVRHRLHGWLVSRDVAEHLALDEAGIADLVMRCHAWFGTHDLGAPSLYVPPAWAMGAIRRTTLATLPFRRYESLTGVFDARENRFTRQPLVGYEADTRLRMISLRALNFANLMASRFAGALRIAIHPRDLELRLADDLVATVLRFAPRAA